MRSFMKDPMAYRRPVGDTAVNILQANDADHTRFRRLLSHAFSEKALKEQTGLINDYVDLLIDRLNEHVGEVVDYGEVVQLYHL